MQKRGKKIFGLLAELLEYPTPAIVENANEAIAVLENLDREAKRHCAAFRDFCIANPLDRVEDIYRKTFDLNAACCPCVGHHLFGHSRSRSLFAERVKEQYVGRVARQKKGAPDHIAIMLRSLVVQESVEEARELIGCCLIPAVRKMIAQLTDVRNPYRHALQAVLSALETEDRKAPAAHEQFALSR